MTTPLYIPGKSIETLISSEVREFGALDAKGRKIGGRASIYSFEFVAFTEEEIAERKGKFGYSGTVIQPERAGKVLFGMRPHALRDGKSFGAYHGASALHETLEEAQADAVKYFEKRDVTKAASIALDETEALALFKALKDHFEPAPIEGGEEVIAAALATGNRAIRAAIGDGKVQA